MSDYSGGGYGGNDARIQNIENQIATLFRWAGTVTRAHNAVSKQVGDIMSDTQTTHDEIAQLTTDVAQNQADEQAMAVRIDALVAAGQPLSASDATALKAALGVLEGSHQKYGAASTPATGAGTPSTPTTPATSAPARTLYTFDGDASTVDHAEWPTAAFVTADGKALYYFKDDVAPGDAKGDAVGGVWHRYTGATNPAPTPAPTDGGTGTPPVAPAPSPAPSPAPGS